jgi:hypothetical protein
MPDRTAIQSLILESVQMLAEDFELEALKAPGPQTALYGGDGSLDSMALADEKAMSAKNSPYRNVASLTDAVIERMPT